jgi:tRNA(Ile)-lysidine synthase
MRSPQVRHSRPTGGRSIVAFQTEHTRGVKPDQALISRVRIDTIVPMLLKRVRATIDQHRMLNPGEAVLVAVSGGIDSVVLLDLLLRLTPEYAISLHVAHLDHGLRPASTGDARFVERLAEERGLPIHVSRLAPDALAAHRKHGPEGAAREARHAFLERVAAEIGAERIAVGHTANDQAETILHRLARGAGMKGLRGIRPVRSPYVRPLIQTTRDEILAYAQERRLTWRNDASNADVSFARNRIRHRVLPELEAINPKVVEAICRASLHAAEAEEASRFLVSMLWDTARAEEGEERLTLRRDALISYPDAVRKLLLREGARRVRGNLTGMEHDHVEAAGRLIAVESSHGEVSLPGLHVRVQNDEVLLSRGADASLEPWAFSIDLGETEIPQPRLTIELAIIEEEPSQMSLSDRWTELADADRVVFPLELRSRRTGDRFAPFGLGTSLKLKDFLINERVPYFDRGRVPLLCDREKIVWVVGVRLSDEVRITETTRRYLSMRARKR